METIVALIPIFPLAGFLIIGLTNKILPKPAVSLIACGSVFMSFAFGVISFFTILGMPSGSRFISSRLFDWIISGSFSSSVSFVFDPLAAVMVLVVSAVGFLIHVYSIGYMGQDTGYSRYFSYLNLFTFAMLVLVLADNILLMFIGWEGVGLCSYLLIGFWFHKKSASDAGKKAFIVNRIGDFGFLLGIMLIFWTLGTLNIQEISRILHQSPELLIAGGGVVTAITLLLFLGATGKSAQIPLYVWLPDAMEGPTPVSALIHAATMVTAGVYMVARLSALFVLSPLTMTIIAIVGGVTALFAATIGLVQNDIKRVLAYSTISQIGYMFLACGVGAFAVGIFHLTTHAFFKALLFLGSGSVIHALSGEQDMRYMGGLKNRIPHTYKVFLVGTLAISGIPLFSGFFSKDEILWNAYLDSTLFWLLGLITAILTAFYMFRLLYLTFHGKSNVTPEADKHVHESPSVMLIPLYILAFLAIVGGYIGLPPILGGGAWFDHFLAPVMAAVPGTHETAHHTVSTEYLLMLTSIIAALLGITIAYMYYIKNPDKPKALALKAAGLYRLLLNKYYIDELYDYIVVNPLYILSLIFWKIFDIRIVDGFANGLAKTFGFASERFRIAQTGMVRNYALSFLLGVIILTGYYILR